MAALSPFPVESVGAKLALGLSRVLPSEKLTIVANTGDDFEHLGLHISPDVDTLLYTLAGVNNPETGWGRAEETWACISQMGRLRGETWFRLGDKDIALHSGSEATARSEGANPQRGDAYSLG